MAAPRKTTVKKKEPHPTKGTVATEEVAPEPETQTQGAGEPPKEPPETAVATGGPDEEEPEQDVSAEEAGVAEQEKSAIDEILNDDTTRTLAEKKADAVKADDERFVRSTLTYVDHSPNGAFFGPTTLLPKGLTTSLRWFEENGEPKEIVVGVRT